MSHADSIIRLLIVEDNNERIEIFRQWLPEDIHAVFATSPGRARQVITLDPGAVYAGILLDHDLHDQVLSPDEYRFSGSDIARLIATHIAVDVPVLVHSMNMSRGTDMQQILEAAGFSVTRIPFQWLTRDGFDDWIEDVRVEREYR